MVLCGLGIVFLFIFVFCILHSSRVSIVFTDLDEVIVLVDNYVIDRAPLEN